jgi:hypothetical protein
MAKIRGVRINMGSVNKKVAQSRKYNQGVDQIAQRRFNEAKRKLMEDFDNHPVTQELKSGPSSTNLSDTLGGYGNLFSYIGFPEGTDPTVAVRAFLQASIRLKRSSSGGNLNVSYSVHVPSLQDFDFAKMPWEGGNNWVSAIESGISGFSYYMTKAADASRSGSAIQIDSKIRARGSSVGVSYITKVINKFRQRIIR